MGRKLETSYMSQMLVFLAKLKVQHFQIVWL